MSWFRKKRDTTGSKPTMTVRRQKPTPLMKAVQQQDVAAVRSRIAAGDDIDATDSWGQTALHWAAKYESEEVVRLLLSAGANAGARDEDGDTPVDAARSKGRSRNVKLLTRG